MNGFTGYNNKIYNLKSQSVATMVSTYAGVWQACPSPVYVFHPPECREPASAASVLSSRVTFLSKVLMGRQHFGRIPYCIEEFFLSLWLVVEDQKSAMDLMRPVDCENSNISRKVLQHKKSEKCSSATAGKSCIFML